MRTTVKPPGSEAGTVKLSLSRPEARAAWSVDAVAPYVLFFAAAFVYFKTLCPTIFADDCGEIATAIVTGGVMHPPGYPLYTLIGRLFVSGIPFHEPAWRLGLISVLAGAGAVAATYKLTRRAGAVPIWSIASALAFAFSLSLWRQATKVETYAFNALFVTLILNSAAAYGESGKRLNLMATGLLIGLALTNHLTVVCVIPAALWLIAARLGADRRRIALAAASIALVVAPLSLYGLIWIAALHHPGGQIWGDPDSIHRFRLQVSGARYRLYLVNHRWLNMAQRDLVDLPTLLWRNLGWFLIGIVPGVARGLYTTTTRRLNEALLIAFVLYVIETSNYGILNIFEYYTPIILLLSVWAGVGMDAILAGLFSKFGRLRRYRQVLQIGLAALVCVGALTAHWSACDRSRATFIRDLAINTLHTMPPNAVLIAIGDNRNFPIWYVQDVLGYRRDVTVVPRSMLTKLDTADGRSEMGWLLQKLHKEHPDIVDADAILAKCVSNTDYARAEGPTWDIASHALSMGRSVLLSDIEPADLAYPVGHIPVLVAIGPDLSLEPFGLANLIVESARIPDIVKQAGISLAVENQIRIEPAPDALMQDEPDGNVTNEIYAQMLTSVADQLNRAHDDEDALSEMKKEVALVPTAAGYDQLGYLALRLRRGAESVRDYTIAVSMDRENTDYQMHLDTAKQAVRQMAAAGHL